MGGGFLRDVALRKQLEDKVKEAAKSRQLAEEEVHAAKAMVDRVKKIGGTVTDAERALADATAAMGSKEYKVALERAAEAKEWAKRSYADRARHFMESTRSLMRITHGLGVDTGDGLAALDRADGAFAREDYEDAVDLAQKAWKKIEKGLHEHLSSSFSTAQSLILTAKNIGKDTAAAEDLLSRARSAVESNDFEQAIAFTQECLESVSGELREEIERGVQQAREAMRMAQELGADPSGAARLLERAQSDVEHGDYDKALNSLRQARAEAEKTSGRSLESRSSDFAKLIAEAEKIGADVGPARSKLSAFDEAMRKGSVGEATNLAREGSRVLHKAQFDRVLLTISGSRDKFLAAKNVGADLTPVIEWLNRARLALQAGKFQDALAASRTADDTVEQILREFRDVEREVRTLQGAFAEAERLGVNTSSAKRFLERTRASIAQKDFRAAVDHLHRTREEFERARSDRAMEAIEKAEFRLTSGEKMGANLEEAGVVLEEAVTAGKERNFEKATELAVRSREVAERATHRALTESVAGLHGSMEYLGDGAASVRSALDRAESALGSRDFDAAHACLEEARRLAEGGTKDRALQFRELLRAAVQLGIQVGCEVSAFEAGLKQANSDVDRGRYAEAVALRGKLGRDIGVLADNLFNLVKAKVVEAKNLRIDITEMRELLKRAKLALGVEDYAEAVRLLSTCNDTASKTIGVHKDVYNAISSAAALVAEAKKKDVNVSKVLEMLLEAKRAHERFDHERALELAQRAKAETEKLMILYASAQRIIAARELIDVMGRAGIEAPHLKDLLEEAKEAMKNKEYERAFEYSERGEREVRELLQERVTSMLSASEASIGSSEDLNLAKQEEKLIRARELLDSGELAAAVQLAGGVREEIEAIRKSSEQAAAAIARAKDLLTEIEAMNVESAEGARMLDRAAQASAHHRFDEALTLGQQAMERLERDRAEQVGAMIARFEEALQRAKRDKVDTRSAEKLLARSKDFLNERKYRQALALAMQSEGEAEKVGLQQDMASKAIATAAKRLSGFGAPMPHLEKMLEEAKRALEGGDYVRALDVAIKTGEEFNHLRAAYEEALGVGKRAQRLREAAVAVGLDTSDIDAAMIRAQEAVREGRLEDARDLYQGAMDESLAAVRSEVQEQHDASRALVEGGKRLGCDMAAPNRKLSEAKALLDAEDFENAVRILREGRDAATEAVRKLVEEEIMSAESNLEHLRKLGADVRRTGELVAKAKEEFSVGAFEAAFAHAKESHAAVQIRLDSEKRFAEHSLRAESMIRQARRFGIDVHQAEGFLEEAIRAKKSDYDQAMKFAGEARRLADQAIEAFSPRLTAKLEVHGPVAAEWTDATLTLTNDAKALAKDVRVKILGDAEVEGLKDLPGIKAKGTESIPLKVRMTAAGSVPLAIQITSSRLLDGKAYEAEVIATVEVASPKSPEPRLQAEAESRCPVCRGLIKVGFTIRRCPHCEKDMHELCYSRTGQCAACGQALADAKRKKISFRVG